MRARAGVSAAAVMRATGKPVGQGWTRHACIIDILAVISHASVDASTDDRRPPDMMTRALDAIDAQARQTERERHLCDLVARIARRDHQSEPAFAELYDLTVARVASIIARFCADRGLIAELTQDAFFQAWNQAHLFNAERGGVLAWLLVIARSRALDALRRKNAQPVLFNSDVADAMLEVVETGQACGAEALQARRDQSTIQTATLALSPVTRHMLALSFFSGLSHAEISDHLRLPLGTVKSTLRRGLASMLIELERLSPGIGMRFGMAGASS
jgi:RNA polymerase sigma factor (sigma-70 family)